MMKVKDIRASIDQTLDWWEAAASAMEKNVESTLAVVSERLDAQKEKTAEASEKLKQAFERGEQLSAETRDKIAADLDYLKVQLALGRAEGRDAVLAQKQQIAEAVQRTEKQIDQIGQQVDQTIDDAVKEWVRAESELRQEFELAAARFENEQAERRAQFEATKQEMLDDLKKFREQLEQKRSATLQKGSAFAADMTAAYEQMQAAFRNLTK